jgi:quercetin dioxygenase-like cupin family protein
MEGTLMVNTTNSLDSSKEMFELAYKTISELSDENAISFALDLPSLNEFSFNELITPSLLPVVNVIQSVGATSKGTSALVGAIKNTYELQAWRQPYSAKEIGAAFTNGSAWFPIADANGPVVHTEGLMEIMLLDAGITYPRHSHSPEELYVVLAGQVWWEADDGVGSPMWKKAGDVIHHLPHQVHAISAGEEAVLILNLWRGGGFEMPSINN